MDKTVSINKNKEFHKLYKSGNFFVGKFIVLYVKKNKFDFKRLGITASRKVGKSVKRNRIRRLIKENYRLLEFNILDGYDLVFVARNTEELPGFTEIKKEMKFLLRKLNVLNKEKLCWLKDG